MENDFVQMGAAADLDVLLSVGPISEHILDYVRLYFDSGCFNIGFQMINCLWIVLIALIPHGTPQIKIQTRQTTASSSQFTSPFPFLTMRPSNFLRISAIVTPNMCHGAPSC